MKRHILGFYGDDFTGSTDAMEALSQYGLKTILFLKVPDQERLNQFQHVDCIGVAGTARAKGFKGMEEEISPVFEFLKKCNPYFVHYKVCSTFDSSPEVGNIGFASDLARKYFADGSYPLLVAAPNLGRYTVFGNHFAKFKDEIYRLDRHPVMAKHPVTPMDEADLVKHLSTQTNQRITNVSVMDLEAKSASEINQQEANNAEVVLYDALNHSHMKKVSEILWEKRKETTQFVIGSSGVEYALGDAMQRHGHIERVEQEAKPNNVNKIFAVSGSVSEVTKQQLDNAEEAGFRLLRIPYELFTDEEKVQPFLLNIAKQVDQHKKVIIYTARGADDPHIARTREHLFKNGVKKQDIGIYIGEKLGRWTKQMLDLVDLQRVIISGGDTSGFVTSNLDIYGLEVIDSIAPGAPLCLAYSERAKFDGLEISLKSGQLGGPAFFEKVYQSGSK
ncbi:four-carbon acid sugar kinase family protein [Gracilibacillus salinarum]|uniref:Four-carbon acid sugar kinase family protein n=1 Tax=Gracilibacillus salinarum TaxID=2932255 RepID=A0ABY4GHI8_9BACI|nr:four-carbon acid sugar kinase family protein [Gracilibacillus salinarum]UOQ83679.1 four-carbon acid sugar kinase family protein [Gracilibacillus salinarum]